MKTPTGSDCSKTSFVTVLAAGCAAMGVMMVGPAEPDARVAPNPGPSVASGGDFVCAIPTESARSVQSAYDEHYECVQPHLDEWLGQYPEEVGQLEKQYRAWRTGQGHDARDRDVADWLVEEFPVDFEAGEVQLTDRQIEAASPAQSDAEPAAVSGAFQRLFVDRDEERLFLSSATEGLVDLDISERYDFEVQGSTEIEGEDFFVIDGNTAVMEEESAHGHAGDLVVLDISDRADPQEINRLEGVLPEARSVNTRAVQVPAIPDRPPTFDEYLAIKHGELNLMDCGSPPTVSAHPDQHCWPDQTCWQIVERDSYTDDGYCARNTPVTNYVPGLRAARPDRPRRAQPRIGRRSPVQDEVAAAPAPQLDVAEDSAGGDSFGAQRESASGPQPDAEVAEEPMPEGGEGGAGSLSQMMVHDSTLYVLTADGDLDHGWLTTFDISDERSPRLVQIMELDNGPEALQLHDHLLLIAGRDALVTATAVTNNGPRLLGERRQRCPVNWDPVVVEGSIAYRTVIIDQPRSRCNSRLEVIDLSEPHQPEVLATERIQRPRGLAVLDDRLFVADEPNGVKVYDLRNPDSPSLIDTWELSGVQDLVISDFDLYAMTSDEVEVFYVAPLFGAGVLSEIASEIQGHRAVVREDE